MIDTDKYEGHTEGPWCYYHSNQFIETEEGIHLFTNCGDIDDPAYDANSELVADAPLLLAEVKRLREEKTFLWETYLKESAEVKRLREGINEVMNECWPNATTMMKKLMEMIE